MLLVVTGGARSGKSSLALERARTSGGEVVFVATCPRIDGDDELADRIEAHQAERPAHWRTIEAEYDLVGALTQAEDRATVVVDCLTLWVNNLLFRGDGPEAIEAACRTALERVAARSGDTIAVTNEVGLGIVPIDPETRHYRDVLGRVNQLWVDAADHALFLVAGRALRLQPPDELLP